MGDSEQAPATDPDKTGRIEGLVEGKDFEIVDKATNSISEDTVWEEVKVYNDDGTPTETKMFFTHEDAWVTWGGTDIKPVTHKDHMEAPATESAGHLVTEEEASGAPILQSSPAPG